MNRAEVVELCRYVKRAVPSQPMTEETPDTWFDVFAAVDMTLVQAKAAAAAVARRRTFIDPNEVIAEHQATTRRQVQSCTLHGRRFPAWAGCVDCVIETSIGRPYHRITTPEGTPAWPARSAPRTSAS